MKRKDYIKSCEISKVMSLNLGGIDQKVSIEGKKKDLPILVYLHGGPGTPLPMNVGTRGATQDITDKFILVCWDQIGSGINNCSLENITPLDIIEMTKELMLNLRKMFPSNKLLVFGSSWGSYLASEIAEAKYTDGIVIWGQIIKDLHHNKYTYACLEKYLDKAKVDELKNKTSYTKEDWKVIQKIIKKKSDGLVNKQGGKGSLAPFIKAMLASKDYKLKDIIAIFNNGYTKDKDLFNKASSLDLTNTLTQVKVPYVILEGKTDLVTPGGLVEEYLKEYPNPNISLRYVKNSAHIPSNEGMGEVIKELIKLC